MLSLWDPIKSKFGDLNYLISTPDRRKGKRVCLINMLKPYFDRETAEPQHNTIVFPMATVVRLTEGKTLLGSKFTKDRLQNSSILGKSDHKVKHLSRVRSDKNIALNADFCKRCSDVTRQTQLRREHTFACSEKCGLVFNILKSLFPSEPVFVTFV